MSLTFIAFIEKAIEQRIPRDIEADVEQALKFAGEDIPARRWLAQHIIVVGILSFIFAVTPYFLKDYISAALYPYFTDENLYTLSAILFLASVLIFSIIIYLSLYYKIADRRTRTQEALPFFLSNVAMNINAGIEPLSALYISLRPEFSPISDEMKKVRSLVLGPKSIIEQLSLIKERIASTPLHMAIAIIERASRSGGNLAKILETIARDIRETNELQKELRTATRGYVYFILFVALIGIPLLLAVVSTFVKLVATPLGPRAEIGALFGGAFGVQSSQSIASLSGIIDVIFGVMLAIGAISASLILGILWSGEVRGGVKYILILLPLSIVCYFLFGGVARAFISVLLLT
jgi:hypothetical protein